MAEMDMSQDPGDQGGEGAANPGFTICVYVGPDGKMTVGVEPPESPEENAAEGATQGMPVPNARAALDMVMEVLRNGGKMPDGSGEDEFNKGFGKPQGAPMMDKMKFDGDDR